MPDLILNRRSGLKLAGVAALSGGLGACGAGGVPGFEGGSRPSPSPAPQTPAGAGVAVALIVPLTAGGQGGVAGNALKNAAEMALAEFQNPNCLLYTSDAADE